MGAVIGFRASVLGRQEGKVIALFQRQDTHTSRHLSEVYVALQTAATLGFPPKRIARSCNAWHLKVAPRSFSTNTRCSLYVTSGAGCTAAREGFWSGPAVASLHGSQLSKDISCPDQCTGYGAVPCSIVACMPAVCCAGRVPACCHVTRLVPLVACTLSDGPLLQPVVVVHGLARAQGITATLRHSVWRV